MEYYAIYNSLNGELSKANCPTLNLESIEITKEVYDDFDRYMYKKGKIVINPKYDEEQAEKRQKEFYSKFLATSKGNYRLQPKGYSNAQQSIDAINGVVNAVGVLNEEIAELVIFYPTPDFTNPDECTEAWLVAHQYNIEPMTKEAWTLYYLEFTRLYAQKQYKSIIEGV